VRSAGSPPGPCEHRASCPVPALPWGIGASRGVRRTGLWGGSAGNRADAAPLPPRGVIRPCPASGESVAPPRDDDWPRPLCPGREITGHHPWSKDGAAPAPSTPTAGPVPPPLGRETLTLALGGDGRGGGPDAPWGRWPDGRPATHAEFVAFLRRAARHCFGVELPLPEGSNAPVEASPAAGQPRRDAPDDADTPTGPEADEGASPGLRDGPPGVRPARKTALRPRKKKASCRRRDSRLNRHDAG
jgi:hypothetical protein